MIGPAQIDPVTSGMSLRDYFAGQALAGILAIGSGVDNGFPDPHLRH